MAEKKKRAKDGRPSFETALAAVLEDCDTEGIVVNRATIRVLGSGEVTYKLHSPGEDEARGGVVSTGLHT